MGNHKYRLSDMMSNAWFYKLRDMNRTRNHSTSSHPIKKKIPSTNTTISSQKPHLSQPRLSSSYHITQPFSPTNPKASDTQFPDPPRKSSNGRSRSSTKRKTIYKPSPRLVTSSVSAHCSCRIEGSADPEPEFESNNIDDDASSRSFLNGLASCSSFRSCRRVTSSNATTDINIDMNDDQKSYSRKFEKLDVFDTISELELPPILTKPVKFQGTNLRKKCSSKFEETEDHCSLWIRTVKEDSNYRTRKETKTSPPIRNSAVKIQANSPRKASKKLVQACGRTTIVSYGKNSESQRRRRRRFDAVRELTDSKSSFQFLFATRFPAASSFSESFALIVKSPLDPQREFKESMVEMIVENNIRESKDLEELLACYLSLNSDEYHHFIVKAFEQIWFDRAHLRMY